MYIVPVNGLSGIHQVF